MMFSFNYVLRIYANRGDNVCVRDVLSSEIKVERDFSVISPPNKNEKSDLHCFV